MIWIVGLVIIFIFFLLHCIWRPRWYLKLKAKVSKPTTYALSDFPEMQDFHDAFDDIRTECYNVLNQPVNHIHRNGNIWSNSADPKKTDEFLSANKDITGWIIAQALGSPVGTDDWLNFPLIAVGHEFKNNLSLCPKLAGLLKKHKKIINICGFSLLKPGAKLKSHVDTTGMPYNTMAYHLGLIVPTDGENNLIVNGETYIQREGQSIIFDSTYLHSANNNSSKDRVILYIDFAC